MTSHDTLINEITALCLSLWNTTNTPHQQYEHQKLKSKDLLLKLIDEYWELFEKLEIVCP